MAKDQNTINRRRGIFGAFLVLFCFLLFFVAGSYAYIQKFDKDLTFENEVKLEETSDSIARHMTTRVGDAQECIKTAASALPGLSSDEVRMEYLYTVAEQYGFAYMGYAGADGWLQTTTDAEPLDVSGEYNFKEAKNGETNVSNWTREILEDRAVSGILLSVPLKVDGENGMLTAMVETDQLRSVLTQRSFDGNGYSYIFETDGTIVMRNKSLALNNLYRAWESVEFHDGGSLEKLAEDIHGGRSGIIRYTSMGEERYGYHQKLPFNNWSVITVVPDNIISAKTAAMTKELIAIVVLLTLMFLVLIITALHAMRLSKESKMATEAKSIFLANISHEIRTPMNVIVGISELLMRQNLPPTQRGEVQNILNSGKGLLTIINDLLDFSKIESGKMTIIEEPYELESLLYDITAIAAIKMGEKPVDFFIEIEPNVPRMVVGDMGRVKQILVNIVGNAIKFTEKGSIHLLIDTSREDDCWLMRIVVRDTGIGISETDIKKLFVSFNQVNGSQNRNVEGTGLGLAISKKLCMMMGGDATVTSEYGQGSAFTMTFKQGIHGEEPMVQKVAMKANLLVYQPSETIRKYESVCLDKIGVSYTFCNYEQQFINELKKGIYTHGLAACSITETLEKDSQFDKIQFIGIYELKEFTNENIGEKTVYLPMFSSHLTNALKGGADNDRANRHSELAMGDIDQMPYVSILIVDDNEVNIQVAQGLMMPYKMKMDSANCGEDAIKAIKAKDYDLIFMDHMMPGMDGSQTLKNIRALPEEKYKNLPVVVLTANVASNASSFFKGEGFDGFLAKPIETMKLDGVLRKWLKDKNLKREKEQADLGEKEIDEERGRMLLGTHAIYIKILKTYLDSTGERLPQLPVWLETDHKRFIVEIHGLKSASASISANGVASLAEELELKGKEEDWDFIRNNLPKFLKRSYVALNEIKNILDTDKDG